MKQTHGFTIIEVVLVLAIAGLIFMMTFLALPALNRTQRDARRRDDISTFLRKVKEYQTNNRGALPNSESQWDDLYQHYLGDSFQDPDGSVYHPTALACNQAGGATVCDGSLSDATPFPNDYKLMIFKAASCKDDGSAERSSNPRKVAVQYKLEGGGVYCADT